MLKNFFSKWFNNSSYKVPKNFKKTNRNIFLNRYAGLVYFLITWHTFGYLIIKFANTDAERRGLRIEDALAGGQRIKKFEFDKNFKLKISEINNEDKDD